MKIGNEEKVFVYMETLKHLTNLNRASEIKAGLILSFYGLLLGVVFQYLTKIVDDIGTDYLFIGLLVSWIFVIAISIYWSFRCFMPHIEGKFDRNVFFFQDAINNYGDIKTYTKRFSEVTSEGDLLYDQLGQQIFIHSKIVATKITDVNKSVKYLAYSFIPLLALLVYTMFIVRPEL
jgi:hypothetical protein